MIDLTQHIVNEDGFSFAMQNVKRHLTDKGLLLATSWLDMNKRKSFYEVSRSLDCYKKEFPGYIFKSPIPFRDKFLLTVKKSPREMSLSSNFPSKPGGRD